MRFRFILAVAFIWFSGSIPASAATISLDFPSSDATTSNGLLGAGGGGIFFQAGKSITETFTSTGLSSAVSSTWEFSMSNEMADTASASFNVLINGTVVDSFSFDGSRGSIENITLTNTFSSISGDSYALSIVATSTVFPGGGSWNWLPGGTVILSDGVSSVPVPAALPLLASALGGFGLLSWRRKRKLAA